MRTTKLAPTTQILSLVLLASAPAVASIQLGLDTAAGHTSNALADSSKLATSYMTIGAEVDFLIAPQVDLRWRGDWRRYGDLAELDHDAHELSLEFQKGSPRGDLLFYTGLYHAWRDYDTETLRLDSRTTGGEAVLQYYLKPVHSLRFESAISSTRFPGFDLADNVRLSFGAGTNLSLPTRTSLDLLARIEQVRYGNLDETVYTMGGGHGGIRTESNIVSVNLLGLETRLAQSLGTRTGATLSAGIYTLLDDEDVILAAPSLSALPQEVLLFAERYAQLKIKRILPRGFVARVSAGVSQREFLDATEDPELPDLIQANREDREHRLGFSVWRSFRIPSGLQIEPVLSAAWYENDSSELRYDTSGLELGLSVSAGF